MKFTRNAGILLHPSSLPGGFGGGDLGPASYRFLDFLERSSCRIWQVLPLAPVDSTNSPYNSPSAFACNQALISPEILALEELIAETELLELRSVSTKAIPSEIGRAKEAILRKIFQQSHQRSALRDDFLRYIDEEDFWLKDYSRFWALKKYFKGIPWWQWPEEFRDGSVLEASGLPKETGDETSFVSFVQFLFERQWQRLKHEANRRNILIFGDIPIFVSHDSVDVWRNRSEFQLDRQGQLTAQSGVPPDYFSEDGQLWGTPLYRWESMRENDYSWWCKRIARQLTLVDLLRIDHFRGFSSYWAVPAGSRTARNGSWVKGPGMDFFKVLKLRSGDLPIIVEDLGSITPEVGGLRDELGFPGMKVLQFAFDGDKDNQMLPVNYTNERNVVYTGTHDNDTTLNWYRESSKANSSFAGYFAANTPGNVDDPVEALIELAMASEAVLAIVPMQDILKLGREARMNHPGKSSGNWTWRLQGHQIDLKRAEWLSGLVRRYRRI